jgi:hypothetical protein
MSYAIEHEPAEPANPEDEPVWAPPSRRSRRRGLTPVTGGLAAIIVAAGGFVGGVQLQKHQTTGTTTARAGGGPTGGFPAGGAPGGPAGAAGGDAATTGTVEYTRGDVLYVKDGEGNTVKVKVKSSSDVTRTASSDSKAVRPGDSVVVQGAANANGTIAATAVTATADSGA